MTGLAVFAALLGGYVAILIAAAFAVRPIRVKLVDLCNDMLDEGGWTSEEQIKLDRFVRTCLSFRIGGLVAFASMICLIDAISGRGLEEEREDRLGRDQRYHRILFYYFTSVLAANPFAAAIAIIAIPLTALIDGMRGQKAVHAVVEGSTLHALAIA